jgi:hypothetical protein
MPLRLEVAGCAPCLALGGGSCCAGTFGAPPIAEQAPISYPAPAPKTYSVAPVGTRVVSYAPPIPTQPIGSDPITARPVYDPPISATGSVGVIASSVSTSDPATAEPVGIVSPQAGAEVPAQVSTPSHSLAVALFAAVLIALLLFGGASVRRWFE